MTIYKLIAGYIIKQMQENCWVMSLSFSLLNLFQTVLFIECSWFVTKKNDQNIGLSILNHGIAHANQLWFSQQWYGANHGANRFADSRRNLGPAIAWYALWTNSGPLGLTASLVYVATCQYGGSQSRCAFFVDFGLCHASRSSIYAIFQLDSDEARPAQKSHPPTPLLGWKWGQWAAVYNKWAKCRPMPSCCGSHWYIGGWVYVRVTIQACSLFEVFEPGNIRFAPASLWF